MVSSKEENIIDGKIWVSVKLFLTSTSPKNIEAFLELGFYCFTVIHPFCIFAVDYYLRFLVKIIPNLNTLNFNDFY
jgi:hypothetical protein